MNQLVLIHGKDNEDEPDVPQIWLAQIEEVYIQDRQLEVYYFWEDEETHKYTLHEDLVYMISMDTVLTNNVKLTKRKTIYQNDMKKALAAVQARQNIQ